MSNKPSYQYQQHPHVQKRAAAGPVVTPKPTAKLAPSQMPEKPLKGIARFNQVLGLAITGSVGTMWAAYAFFALTLVSLPAAIQSGSPIIIVSWVAQTFLQLVLLPVIIVGQNIQAEASEKRAIATYEDATAILEEAKEIQVHLSDQDKALGHLIDRLEAIEAKILKSSK
jgi:hypothetical protein